MDVSTSGESGVVSFTAKDVPVESVLHDLVVVLQKSGEEVLNKQTRKLTLAVPVVRYLNSRFRKLPSAGGSASDGSKNSRGSESENVSKDIQFLWDFFQQAPALKLSASPNRVGSHRVSLFAFRHLKHLVLCKVQLTDVIGLQGLRGQLQSVTCERGLVSLKSLLVRCGGDEAAPFSWPSIVFLDVSYNQLMQLDESLRYAMTLQSLNLSHNQIISTQDFLTPLQELSALNLGFNQLQVVPALSPRGRVHLRILILRGNNLDSLNGLELLRHIQELDLSENCLMTHHQIAPLSELSHLTMLSLSGNPLAFHPQHRCLTCTHLSPHITPFALVLDGKRLSGVELQYLPKADNYGLSVPITPDTSAGSRANTPFAQHSDSTSASSIGGTPKLKKRRSRPRAPNIQDNSNGETAEHKSKSPLATRKLAFETSIDLEQAAAMRRELGEEYLVHMPAMSIPVPNARSRSASNESQSTLPASSCSPTHTNRSSLPMTSTPSDTTDFQQLISNRAPDRRSLASNGALDGYRITSGSDSDSDIGDDAKTFLVVVEESDDEGEKVKHQRFVSLNSKGYLHEKDFKAERVEMLDTGCLLRAELVDMNVRAALAEAMAEQGNGNYTAHDQLQESETKQFLLKLEFDYSRRDRRHRDYIIEDEDQGKALLELLQPIAEKNLAALSVRAKLECLNCSAVFHKDLALNARNVPQQGTYSEQSSSSRAVGGLLCPKCYSPMLVETTLDKVNQKQPLQSHHIKQAVRHRIHSPEQVNASQGISPSTSSVHSQAEISSSPGVLTPQLSTPPSSRRHSAAAQSLMGVTLTESATLPSLSPRSLKDVTITDGGFRPADVNELPVERLFMAATTKGLQWNSTNEAVVVNRDKQPEAAMSNSMSAPAHASAKSKERKQSIHDDFSSMLSQYTPVMTAGAESPPGNPDEEKEGPLPGTVEVGRWNGVVSKEGENSSITARKNHPALFDKPSSLPRAPHQFGGAAVREGYLSDRGYSDGGSDHSIGRLSARSNHSSGRSSASAGNSPSLSYSRDDCTVIGHQLKLNLQLNIFKNNETFICLQRCPVVQREASNTMDCLLVISNRSLYICTVVQDDSSGLSPKLYRAYLLLDVCFINVGLNGQTLHVQFDSSNACYTFLIGDRHLCLDFTQRLLSAVRARIAGKRHTFRGVFYSSYIALHQLRHSILQQPPVQEHLHAYELLSHHCYRKKSSLLPTNVDVLSPCLSGSELVNAVEALRLDTDRHSAVQLCRHLVTAGLISPEGGSMDQFVASDTDIYYFSAQEPDLLLWDSTKWGIDLFVLAHQLSNGGAHKKVVGVLVAGEQVYLVSTNFHLQAAYLQSGDLQSVKEQPFFARCAVREINSISSVVVYQDHPTRLLIEFFEEDVIDGDPWWCLDCSSDRSVESICTALSHVWEEVFHVSLQLDRRTGPAEVPTRPHETSL